MLLLDTNIAIHLRDADQMFVDRLTGITDDLAISLMTLVELKGGLGRKPALAASRRQGLLDLLTSVAVIGFDRAIVDAYGNIVDVLGFSRRSILDRLIAATALVHDLTLVTINGPDFRDIPGLKLEVWPAAQ